MASSGYQSPPPIGRTVDRVFEDAQFTGEIYLNGRKLRDYPKLCSKYDLSDTVLIDISRNRLIDVPQEVCECLYVEKVNCYHNVIRSIPEAIQQLQYLTHLNLSRNQLSVLPPAVCLLGCLEVLWASNNKLVSLPEEIGLLKGLMDLDVSCNEISHLPSQIGDLSSLRSLNLRRNFLIELPVEISRLLLYQLDFSSNRIEKIPNVFRNMETLEHLVLDHNPLASPSAHACIKGRQHIMKYLQTEAVKEDRKRGILINSDLEMKRFVRKSLPPQQSTEELKGLLVAPESKWKRHTVLNASDSGYSTADGSERNGWHSAEEQKKPTTESDWRKKQVELTRVQQEDGVGHEKEGKTTADRSQEDHKMMSDRHSGVRGQDELRHTNEERLQKDRRREEEEDSWRREEDLKKLQETVRIQGGVELRLAGDVHKIESKLIDKNTNSYHYPNSSSQNCNRPHHPPPVPPSSSSTTTSSRLPQPPSYLPVHGFMGSLSPSSLSSMSMSSSSSSSYHVSPQLQQEDNYIISENDYREALSSQGAKDQRRLANSTQYRRPASSGLKKPSQSSSSQHQVDNLNYVNRNGTSEISHQSSSSTTPSVSPGPSPRNSVSLLAKPSSPSGSMSHLAKPSSPSGSMSHLAKPSSPSGSMSHLAKPSSPSGSTSHLAKPTSTKSSVPRATNGAIPSAQSQAARRTKMSLDSQRTETSSPGPTKPTKPAVSTIPAQGPALTLVQPQIRRTSNSNTNDEDSKLKKGPSTPADIPRPKSRLEEPSKKGSLLSSGLKQMQKVAPQEMVDTNKRISTRPPTNSFGLGRGRPAGQKAVEEPCSNFTLRRREEQQREEAEQLDRLRQTVESRLRVTLPDNLAEALRDGVVLCHLANQIRPRSVGSIHVPSPAVPKLTLAKCRRNVDNFLDACRKIGVDQELICGPQDILDEKGLQRVTATVGALVAIGANPKQSVV